MNLPEWLFWSLVVLLIIHAWFLFLFVCLLAVIYKSARESAARSEAALQASIEKSQAENERASDAALRFEQEVANQLELQQEALRGRRRADKLKN